jgi:hypothetical protein
LSLFTLFADDTAVIFSGKSIKCACNVANNELINIARWYNVNRLVLNISKTNCIHFELSCSGVVKPVILLENAILEYVLVVKYLGVYIDYSLSWKHHSWHVMKKVSQGFGIIKYCYHCLPKYVLKMLYFAYIYPYLTYCVECWGNAAAIHTNPILSKQKQIVKMIGLYNYFENSNHVAYMSKMLLLPECYELYVLTFMHSVFYCHCPASIYTLFTKPFHYHSTRLHESIFYVPEIRTSAFRNSTAINGIFLWNNLPESVKSISNMFGFKTVLFKLLLSKYNN